MFEYDPDDESHARLILHTENVEITNDEKWGYGAVWQYGTMTFGFLKNDGVAQKVAAMFVYLWRKKIDCGLARDLAVSYYLRIEEVEARRASLKGAKSTCRKNPNI